MLFGLVVICAAVQTNAIPIDCNILTRQLGEKEALAVNHLFLAMAQLLCKDKEQGVASNVVREEAPQIADQTGEGSLIPPTQIGLSQGSVASQASPDCDDNTGNTGNDDSCSATVVQQTATVENPLGSSAFYTTDGEINNSALSSISTNENTLMSPTEGNNQYNIAINNQPNPSSKNRFNDVGSCLCPANMIAVPVVTIECKNREEAQDYPAILTKSSTNL